MKVRLVQTATTRATPRRQRGAALLMAMIIVTLIATLAASMVWQQWRAVQIEAAERARTQSAWILSGALDWARLILREDQRSGKPTALTEPWAVPLAEARLSTFLAADKNASSDDGPEAFLSGSISDVQARYNLNNLIGAEGIDPNNLEILMRLCQTLGVDAGIPTRIAQGLRDARVGNNANAPLLPQTITQLSWLGVDAGSIQALEPYVVVLPISAGITGVNVNTASPEVLVAVIKGNDMASSERLLQVRQRTPFKTLKEVRDQLPGLDVPDSKLDVKSSFFEVRGRLRLADRILEERSLVQRIPNGPPVVLERQRISTRESTGS